MEQLPQLVKGFLHEAGVEPADISHVIPHQANGVMLDEVLTDLAMPRATMHRTLTTTATREPPPSRSPWTRPPARAPSAPGELILLAGFGGGMAASFALVEW
ncbi:3-oxoacyl-[acyl-carrier-protein] synthase III C-terminal domain-containing protein [Streptomyces sp. DG2A-72]|uniref:3-oxoacyl-[acyl-carrier-protein] synthase III C-terminal domain-containing protein n=1 Tax=Streptomyces sp. DG2A-72 TaxID=3051386 RepID=UPI003463A2C8